MTKIISIADDVYDELSQLKGEASYSVILRGLLHNQSNKDKVLSLCKPGIIDEKKVKGLGQGWKKWTRKYA